MAFSEPVDCNNPDMNYLFMKAYHNEYDQDLFL